MTFPEHPPRPTDGPSDWVPHPSMLTMERSDAARRVVTHMAQVERIAHWVRRRYAPGHDVDDLVQAGLLALVEAAGRWQDRGVPFGAYVAVRVRGAMIDMLRAGGLRGLGPGTTCESVDQLDADSDMRLADPADPVETIIARAQAAAMLAAHIDRLPEREALVLHLYFVEELGLEDIGRLLGVGAARVCQIKRRGLGRLAQAMSRADFP